MTLEIMLLTKAIMVAKKTIQASDMAGLKEIQILTEAKSDALIMG